MTVFDNHLLTYAILQLTALNIENQLDRAILLLNDADVFGRVIVFLDVLELVPEICISVSRYCSNRHIERTC